MGERNPKAFLTGGAVLVCVAALALSCGCGGGPVEVESDWSPDRITVDGRADDWKDAPLTYLEDKQASFGLRNDEESLYLLFSFTDETWLRMISLGGVTLWLDETGGKKKDFGIRYAGGPPLTNMQGIGMPVREGMPRTPAPTEGQDFGGRQKERASRITVIDKKGDKTVQVAADGTNGPSASFAETLGVYTYEFSIPIREDDAKTYTLSMQLGETIGIGLEWGGSGGRGAQRMKPDMPPGGFPGGASGGGGGPPGGPGPGGGPGRKPSEDEIWLKSQLATRPEQE